MSDETNTKDTDNTEVKDSWLSEDLAAIPSLQKFKNPQDLAKSYVEMQTLLGGKTSYPGEGATDEDWEKFYAPLTPKEYDLKFDDLKSVAASEVLTDDLKETAKKLGLTNKQAQGFLDKFRGVLESKETEVLSYKEQLTNEQQSALDTKFGSNLEQVRGQVDDYIEHTYGKDVLKVFQDSLYGNADALGVLFEKAKVNAQDKGLSSDSRSPMGDKREQFEAEFQAFMTGSHGKYGAALLNDTDPKHTEAQKRFSEIQTALHLYE